MILTILLVALGQTYWLFKLYDHEFDNLKKGMNAQFRTSFHELQRIRFLKDSSLFNYVLDTVYFESEKKKITQKKPDKKILLNHDWVYFTDTAATKKLNDIKPENIRSISIVSAKNQPLPPEFFESMILKAGDTSETDSIQKLTKIRAQGINITLLENENPVKEPLLIGTPIKEDSLNTTTNLIPKKATTNQKTSKVKLPMIQVISNNKTLNDSIPLADVKRYFQKSLSPNQQKLNYQVVRERWKRIEFPNIDLLRDTLRGFISSPQLSGIQKTFSYQILFPDVQDFIIKEMSVQILGSILMILILVTSFVFIYHTLHRQRRLADIKNEFISNITHELKTPIATVHVALEALQNFNAIDDPKKTKEYLDISMSELNRLKLLVDNVLKRSMLEKDAIKLELSTIDLQQLLEHVLQTLKLQFEHTGTKISIKKEGDDFTTTGDQLHITSVIYNLLDNALKYSNDNPEISINLYKEINTIVLSIEDNGIGIPKEYQDKIFQPFFRVPNMDRHNVKGYGLGLSYVAQIIKLHNGTINLTEGSNKGSVFTIKLPIA
jgi:signal transduction histidine kinase